MLQQKLVAKFAGINTLFPVFSNRLSGKDLNNGLFVFLERIP